MKKVLPVFILIVLFGSFLIVGCTNNQDVTNLQSIPHDTVKPDVIYQVSLLNGLMLGDYDGTVTVSELQKKGDIGIGTFDQLDGELIMIDGIVYKAKADGSIEVQPKEEKTPFSVVTFFNNDMTSRTLTDVKDIDDLKAKLDQMITEETEDLNRFYAVRIDGDFAMAHVRSVPPQTKPYKPLAEIAKMQKEYTYKNLEGTIVAICCPDYVEGINLPGWHMHYLSKDKNKGGHLLDADLIKGTVQIDFINDFQLRIPDTEAFADLKLTKDLNKDTKQVEGKK